jgi:16S rRNA (cytidine1402-2'-O)-methyltransferase
LGTLFLVATPIGNLEDISARALRVLSQAGLVVAEDTRTTRYLLSHYAITARLLSYTEHNRRMRIPQILNQLESIDVALVSEAGMPAISDPGQELVAAAIQAGHRVSPIPGPSALPSAVAASGLPTRQFTYLGFLPRQPGERRRLLAEIRAETRTLVCFEAPSRLLASLEDMLEILGDRRVALCRELTKVHEEIVRGIVSELLATHVRPRGEYTVVIAGAEAAAPGTVDSAVREQLKTLRDEGLSAREATTRLSKHLGIPRRQLYEAWLELG